MPDSIGWSGVRRGLPRPGRSRWVSDASAARAVGGERRAARARPARGAVSRPGRPSRTSVHGSLASCTTSCPTASGWSSSRPARPSTPGPRIPSNALRVRACARATSLEAIDQLRALLTVVRDDPTADRSPIPTIDDLPALAARTTRAGFRVDLERRRNATPCPRAGPGVVYRVTQEGIANAMKHSGSDGCRIRLAYQPDAVVVEVDDDGGNDHRAPPARSSDWQGSGSGHASSAGPSTQVRATRAAGASPSLSRHDHGCPGGRPGRRPHRPAHAPRPRGGHHVVGEAADGESALAMVARAQPDVVLMDIRMPGWTGSRQPR